MNRLLSLLLSVLVLLISAIGGQSNETGREVVAYFPEWGVYLQPYYVKNIVASDSARKLTVLNYAFAIPGPDVSGDIVCQLYDPDAAYLMTYTSGISVDDIADAESQVLRGHFNQLRKLKMDYPELKVLVAIGGWTGSTYFSDAALTAASRQKFVDSCIDMFISGNLPVDGNAGGTAAAADIFDGFDIDWEYPITGGAAGVHHNSNDDVNLTALLSLFRSKLDEINPDLMLTMATPGSAFRADNYQIFEDQDSVDWFNLMTYDFHGPWEKKTGHLTNLLTSPADPSSDAFKLSVDNTVRLYRDMYGVPEQKLVVGATFYGLGWKNVSPTNNGLYQSGQEAAGIYEDGTNYSKDLAPLLSEGYTLYWDDNALASWLYSSTDNIFWSFDEPQSLALKKRYVDAYNLKGVMFWEISGDDGGGSLLSALVSGNPSDGFIGPTHENHDLVVTIQQPSDCDISMEGFNVVINAATSATNIAQVEFFHNGESLGFDNLPPWGWAWFNLPSGSHTISAVVTDTGGGQNASDSVNITVYGQESGISIWQTGVSYQIGDEVFYQGCVYSANRNHFGSRVRTPESERYWSLITCSDCGGSGGNQLPSVSIVAPEDNATFTEGESIEISAAASDTDGSVDRVEFYQGDTPFCTTTAEPYTCTWEEAPTGTYQLTARAYDDGGDFAEDTITVTVSGSSGCTLSPWNNSTTYFKGDQVVHVGIRWQSKRTSQGVEPGTSPSKWTNLGVCIE